MTKVLFIAHYFPPIGGAGVQRSAKFVKHLPGLGFLPLVLTGKDTPVGRWTPEDQSLHSDIPAEVPVYRAAWRTPDMAPGETQNRRRAAYLDLGDQVICEHRPALIFVTMSPFQDAVLAAELARRHGLPWVADLRDPWALDEFQVFPTRWHRAKARKDMGEKLASAALIIMNTPVAAEAFRREYPHLADKARVSITNGYDADDFAGSVERNASDKFTLVHSGYFHAELGLRQRKRTLEYRLLGRIEPGVDFLPRSHFFLIQALEKLRARDATVASRLRVVCLGSSNETDARLVKESKVADLFEFTGYLPHKECIRRVQAADLLFLPMHCPPRGGRASIVPGKTYEYIASGRPILAAVPEGDARDFLTGAGSASLCHPKDVDRMADILHANLTNPPPVNWNSQFVERFERRNLTRQLADALESVLAGAVAARKRETPK